MAHEVKGVIASAKGEGVTVTTVVVPDPGPGEALVRVQACGVCHTDLHYREGGIGDDFPYLLGHEAAGVVESVGADVTGLAAGRLRHPELARGVRAVPGVPARPAVVLLRDPQRDPEDDAHRRDGALPRAGHRGVRGEDAGRGGPVHQGQPGRPRGGGGAAGLRRDGRAGRGAQHRGGVARRLGRGDRLRRRRRRGGHGRAAGGRAADHRGGRGRPEAGVGPPGRARRTRSTRGSPTRSRRSGRSPRATARTW